MQRSHVSFGILHKRCDLAFAIIRNFIETSNNLDLYCRELLEMQKRVDFENSSTRYIHKKAFIINSYKCFEISLEFIVNKLNHHINNNNNKNSKIYYATMLI